MKTTSVCPGCDRSIDIPEGGGDAACALCGHVVTVELPPEPEVPALATAIRYPFSTPGARMFLLITAPLYAVCRVFPVFPFNLVGQLILGGYIAQWLWEILASTALGRHEAPGAPLSGTFDELAGNFFRFFGAFAVAFGPAALLSTVFWWNDVSRQSPIAAAAALLALAGLFYYPMALLLIGFSERWSAALHLPFALRSIWSIRRDYLTCCVFFLVTFGVSTAVETGVAALPSDLDLLLHFAARLAAVVLEVALYAIQMRAVGLVYLANRERLGWFRY